MLFAIPHSFLGAEIKYQLAESSFFCGFSAVAAIDSIALTSCVIFLNRVYHLGGCFLSHELSRCCYAVMLLRACYRCYVIKGYALVMLLRATLVCISAGLCTLGLLTAVFQA